jgi:hypothetical protein
MKLLQRLWWVVDMNDVDLHVVHVRSADNISDRPSWTKGYEDWQLSPSVFEHYRLEHGYTIDPFASENTALLPRFRSADLCRARFARTHSVGRGLARSLGSTHHGAS